MRHLLSSAGPTTALRKARRSGTSTWRWGAEAVQLPLSRPLVTEHVAVHALTLRRPTAEDLEALGTSTLDYVRGPAGVRVAPAPDRILRWAERLSGIPSDDLMHLSMRDARLLHETIGALLRSAKH